MSEEKYTDEKTVVFQTDCFDCIFNKTSKNTQLGCRFHNRLSLFQEKGLANIVELDDKQSYMIDTVCNAKRTSSWSGAKRTKAQQVELAEKEIRSKYTNTNIVVLATNADLIKAALHINNFANKDKTYFIYLSTLPDIKTLFKIDNSYKIHIPTDKLDLSGAIDGVVKQLNTSHYTIWLDCLPEENYFTKFQNLLIFSVEKLLCWQPKKNEWSGTIVSIAAHNLLGGNYNIPIFEKIKESAEFQKNTEAYHCGPLH